MSPAVIFLVLQLFILVSGQQSSQEISCGAQQTCSSCLQTPTCVWCSQNFTNKADPKVRCVTRDKFNKERDFWCLRPNVYDKSSIRSTPKNVNLSSDKVNPIQVQPQRMNLRLRIGEQTQRVTLKYKQVEDYPVDLYYLMDLSQSMRQHRDALSKLGKELVTTMKNLTSNFRLGFGSFIDKVVLPMTSTAKEKLIHPCKKNLSCAAPYDFQHQMRLTEDYHKFGDMEKEAKISANLDAPEGGFDALMQVMVCTEEIGWRPDARHLVIFSTDSSFHIAGDGRLAGIIEPNDRLCHLDKDGSYTHSLLLDYPSISQISREAAKKNVNIIFAVTKDMITTYDRLRARIKGISVGRLDDDPENVAALIGKEYEKLKDTVHMVDNKTEFINVRYFSKCLDGVSKERNSCVGRHKGGDVIEFEIDIQAIKCPTDPKDWHQTLQIKPLSLNESLIIDLELVCQCDCEKSGQEGYKHNAESCNGHGDMKCGVCSCNSGFHGKQCQCKGNEAVANSDAMMDKCRRANETKVCSGHGVCSCGVCACLEEDNRKFYGDYCECANFTCKRDNNMVCGGHGQCECGTCKCDSGWGGEACTCEESTDRCTPHEENSKICNGRGECVCGRCECKEKDGILYSGDFCDECPTCPNLCDYLKDCVECIAYKAGPLSAEGLCETECKKRLEVTIEDEVVEDSDQDGGNHGKMCKIYTDAGCTFAFKYVKMRGDSNTDFQIVAEKNRVCQVTVNLMGVATGVIVSTVFLGFLLLIIWKLLTMFHDQREFAKFEKERASAKWDRGENPLYKQATSSFENPTFAESDNTKY